MARKKKRSLTIFAFEKERDKNSKKRQKGFPIEIPEAQELKSLTQESDIVEEAREEQQLDPINISEGVDEEQVLKNEPEPVELVSEGVDEEQVLKNEPEPVELSLIPKNVNTYLVLEGIDEEEVLENDPELLELSLIPKNVNAYLVPQTPRIPKTPTEKESTRRLIVVLEAACLMTYKFDKKKTVELLNCDDHRGILQKLGRNPSDSRPDITHQCLMQLLDTPLNKAGLLQIYVHTAKGVLIEVNPHVRIPRTFKRFSGLMVQLLHKLSVSSIRGSEKLLRVIKNPVTQYLPTKCKKLTLSFDAKTVRLRDYLPTIPSDHSICVAIGAMAHGPDTFADDWVDEKIGISEYSLSAAVTCAKFCCTLEDLWNIV
ncbi:hypothetical protein G9A89_023967 [Geosiphon pyriformis]|nr:hypothetical protein G9A89_023967 [Geosiphon pyriformis]